MKAGEYKAVKSTIALAGRRTPILVLECGHHTVGTNGGKVPAKARCATCTKEAKATIPANYPMMESAPGALLKVSALGEALGGLTEQVHRMEERSRVFGMLSARLNKVEMALDALRKKLGEDGAPLAGTNHVGSVGYQAVPPEGKG